MRLILKWVVLVLLCSSVSFVAAINTDHLYHENYAGIALGIVTFIIIYSVIDKVFIISRRNEWSKSLESAVVIKMALQLIPVIELSAGIAAGALVVEYIKPNSALIESYLITVLVGVLLSVVVSIIYGAMRYISRATTTRPD